MTQFKLKNSSVLWHSVEKVLTSTRSKEDHDKTKKVQLPQNNVYLMIRIFRIGRSVMKSLSSVRCFNMPIHCNSDVFTTCDQVQDCTEQAAVRI